MALVTMEVGGINLAAYLILKLIIRSINIYQTFFFLPFFEENIIYLYLEMTYRVYQ